MYLCSDIVISPFSILMHSSSPTLSALTTPPCLLDRWAQRCQNRGRHFKNASFFCPRQRIIDPANQSQRASWKLRPMKSDGRRGLRTPTRTQWLSTGERVRDDAWCWFKETGLRIGKVCALLPLPPTLENRSLNYCTGENLDLWQHYLERDTP